LGRQSAIQKLFLVAEILLVSAVYFIFYFLKTGSIFLSFPYDYFILVFIITWQLTSLYFDGSTWYDSSPFTIRLKAVVSQFFTALFILSLICSVSVFSEVSRLFLVKIVFGSAVIKSIFFVSISYDRKVKGYLKLFESKDNFKLRRLVGSGFLLTLSFITVQYIHSHSLFFYYEKYETTILLLIFAWFISSILTGKFFPHTGENIYYKIAPFLKASFLMLFLTGTVFYWGRLDSFINRSELFTTVIVFSSVEILLAMIRFYIVKDASYPIIQKRRSHFNQSQLEFQEPGNVVNRESFLDHVQSIRYNDNDTIINDTLRNAFAELSFTPGDFRILFDRTSGNINLSEPESFNCLLNYCQVNDIYRINDYLASCYNVITPLGYLIGFYIPQEHDRHELEKKMPRSVFVFYCPAHYVLKRIMPKLPYLGKLYDIITDQRNRLISRAELLGRLAYAGFSVKFEQSINGKVLFMAQKVMTPAQEEFPSYGPIVRLKRIGLNGQVFRIFKFRTMYPYSEFIQKEVFEKNSLDDSGKLKNDFRRNSVGNILRKLWLDELPQLFNWLKGDVNLVGVRALSEQYFNLYPKDLQELRIQFKPGLVPPYYADMPKSFDEIVDSERRYLLSKKEKPFTTDIKYFCKAFVNIVFKGARSG